MKIHGLLAFTAATAVALPLSWNVERGTPSPGQYADSKRRSDPAEDFIDATMAEYALAKAPVSERTKRFDTRDDGVISTHQSAEAMAAAYLVKRPNYVGGKPKARDESVLPIEDIVKHPDYFGGKSKARDQQGSTQLRGLFIRPEYDGRKLKTRDEDANAPAYLVKRPDYVGGKHKARGLEELAKRPEYAGGKRDDGIINAHRSERLGKRPTYDGGKRNGITTGKRAEDIVKRPVYSGGKR